MDKVIKSIPITIRNQHELLNLLAEGYKSLSKSLMEYIDNAFDSAEDIFDDKSAKYARDILIEIIIDRANNEILVKDNCEGMDSKTIEGLANSINESQKKRREQKRAWVNGQFGLGAHAYRFFAQELQVTSQKKKTKPFSISIDRDSANANLIQPKAVLFDPSGTLVELCKVDKGEMKHLKAIDLKKNIEVYFEMLLRRNVQIKITDGSEEFFCQPFDYKTLNGFKIEKIINSWHEGKTRHQVLESKGILVNLKICTEKVDRPPFFARKGRRINYIADLESFMRKTEHRKKVWEHYYLTGYIEVQENLEPVVTRDDFVGGKGMQQRRTGIYNEIVKLEDEIHSAIELVNKDKRDESLKDLASKLTDILSQLAREDELNVSYQNPGNRSKQKNLEKIDVSSQGSEEFLVDKKGNQGEQSNEENSEETVRGEPNEAGKSEGVKKEKFKPGISIDFSPLPSDKRSHYGDGLITVFTSHKDFLDRVSFTQQGELGSMKITARMANYLCAVISSEFKEVFYQQKRLEPDRKSILDEQIDFIFKFEDRMKDFIDQPLHSIGRIKK